MISPSPTPANVLLITGGTVKPGTLAMVLQNCPIQPFKATEDSPEELVPVVFLMPCDAIELATNMIYIAKAALAIENAGLGGTVNDPNA